VAKTQVAVEVSHPPKFREHVFGEVFGRVFGIVFGKLRRQREGEKDGTYNIPPSSSRGMKVIRGIRPIPPFVFLKEPLCLPKRGEKEGKSGAIGQRDADRNRFGKKVIELREKWVEKRVKSTRCGECARRGEDT